MLILIHVGATPVAPNFGVSMKACLLRFVLEVKLLPMTRSFCLSVGCVFVGLS